jgi:16S rRNA (cytosine967-C5)-methyltransferase
MSSRRVQGLRNTLLRAVRVLRDVVGQRKKLEMAWAVECHRSKLQPRERRLLRDVCSGTLRHYETYKRLIDYYANGRVADDPKVQLLMASTLYQSEHMERAPGPSALRAAAVSSCTALERSWATRGVDDLCRKVLELTAAERRAASTAASELSLPSWLYERLRRQGPLASYGRTLLRRPDFLCVCVPPAKYGSRERFLHALQEYDESLRASRCSFAPHGVVIHSRPRDVEALPGVSGRLVHVQDSVQQYGSSLLAPLATGERMLDACAAPGGKTRAALLHQQHAQLVAVDSSPTKVGAMRTALASELQSARLPDGSPRLSIICADAAKPETWWDGVPFDAISLDPPCTATALLRTLPEVKAQRSEEDLPVLRMGQLRLLRALWPLLRPGGQMLYTTCSILQEENGDVVREFLRTTPGARAAHHERPPGTRPPLVAVHKHGIAFYPSTRHQGGFLALIQKLERPLS